MKKIFKPILFLLVVITLVFGANSIFAQTLPINVTFTVKYSLYDYKLDDSGNYYYDISGTGEIDSSNKTIYLILENSGTKSKTTLCTLSNIGTLFEFKYPSTACGNVMPSLVSGVTYGIYFSDIENGRSVSEPSFYELDEIPAGGITQGDIFIDWDVELKEQADKYYYDISTIVKERQEGRFVDLHFKRSGDVLRYHLMLGSIELSMDGMVFNASTKNLLDLSAGSYEIVVTESGDDVSNPIQTYTIGDSVPSEGTPEGGDPSGSGTGGGINDGDGLVSTKCGYGGGRMCNFTDLMGMLNRIINYIFVLVLPIAAIVFAYAGYLYIVSAGDPKKRTAAKNAMTKLIIGIIIIMLAWIIVKTILGALGVQGGFSFLGMRD